MRMIASRGFRMRGSGTSSTRSFSLPYQTFAFILGSGSIAAGQAPTARRAADHAAPPRGLTEGRGDLAGFQQLLEPTQILLDLCLRVLPQQLRARCRAASTHRAVADTQPHDGAAPLRSRLEINRAGVGQLRPVERAPGERRARAVLSDFTVPLQPRAGGALGDPVETALINLLYRLEVLQEAGQVLDLAPEAVAFFRRLRRRNARLEILVCWCCDAGYQRVAGVLGKVSCRERIDGHDACYGRK